jgi:probable addiction module antidote protein
MALFNLALKNVADARLGGMTALSKSTEMTRERLYRALSAGIPRLDTLTKVLHAVGLRISVTPEITSVENKQ